MPLSHNSILLADKKHTHFHKIIPFLFWLIIFVGYWWYAYQHQLSPLTASQHLIQFVSQSIYGPLIYLIIYAVRPLTFVSSTLLSSAAGYLFGPVWGVGYALLGSNTSATIAYAIGRYFGQGIFAEQQSLGILQKFSNRLQRNSFAAVLLMRFLFFPYDVVSYASGFLQVRWRTFALATFLGGLSGTISFVLLGASLEGEFSEGVPTINTAMFGLALALFLFSLGLSFYLKWRDGKRTSACPNSTDHALTN